MSKLVSVIIPTYNAESTIQRAINSILKQTYKNIEVVVCDDLSDDNTIELVEKMCASHDNVRLLKNKKNMKSAFTRNRAISESKGEYIAQLDDDDYCDETRIEKQVNYLEENKKISFVGSSAYIFDKSGIYEQFNAIEFPKNRDFLRTSPFINSSVMFRRDSLIKVGGYRISNETRRGQDYDLYLRMYVSNMKGNNLQEKLVYYYKDDKYFSKINWRDRIGEFKFRYRNFKKLGLLPKYIFYVLKPLIAMIIPNRILLIYNKSQKNRKQI